MVRVFLSFLKSGVGEEGGIKFECWLLMIKCKLEGSILLGGGGEALPYKPLATSL